MDEDGEQSGEPQGEAQTFESAMRELEEIVHALEAGTPASKRPSRSMSAASS